MAATARCQMGHADAMVDESHLGQKPKLGGVCIPHRHLFYFVHSTIACRCVRYSFVYLVVGILLSLFYFVLFAFLSRFLLLFSFLCLSFLFIIKKTKNIFFGFLFGRFLSCFSCFFLKSKTTKRFLFLGFFFSFINRKNTKKFPFFYLNSCFRFQLTSVIAFACFSYLHIFRLCKCLCNNDDI